MLSPPFCSLSLLVVTQIRGDIAGSSLLSTTVRALQCYREKISDISSLADSRRNVLTHARRSQQLILFILANKPRRDSNSRTDTTSSIRRLPLNHRGDCAEITVSNAILFIETTRCTATFSYYYYINCVSQFETNFFESYIHDKKSPT